MYAAKAATSIVAPSVCWRRRQNVAAIIEPPEIFSTSPGAGLALRTGVTGKAEPVNSGGRRHRAYQFVSRSSEKSDDGKQFWRKVNYIAFQRLDAWVPEIFGSAARFEPGTGAYRISSQDLGRDLEEDLSISPAGRNRLGRLGHWRCQAR